jgi:hypothetical protein
MAFTRSSAAAGLVAPAFVAVSIAAGAVFAGAVAAAGPVWPLPGGGSASDTIADLEDQGYNVQINWVNGRSTTPLSQCSVSAIHNPNRSTDPPDTFTTVYVDVSCPDDDYGAGFGSGFGGGFGIGFGFG